MIATVDDCDFEWANQWKWRSCGGYAVRAKKVGRGSKCVAMHREMLSVPKGMEVDHINSYGLDNRRENLRICTTTENAKNRKINKNNTSGYKGVHWHKTANTWQVYLACNKKRIHIGHFTCLIKAAKAYDEAARKYHGEFANTNF